MVYTVFVQSMTFCCSSSWYLWTYVLTLMAAKKQTSNIHIFKTNIKTQHFQSLWWKQPVTFHWHWHFTAAFLFFAPPCVKITKGAKSVKFMQFLQLSLPIIWELENSFGQCPMDISLTLTFHSCVSVFVPPAWFLCLVNVTNLQIPHICHPSHTSNLILFTHRIPHTSYLKPNICHPSAYLIFCRRLCPGRKLMWRQF